MAIKLKPVTDPTKIYPARVYDKLAVGFDTKVNWETQSTIPVENSDKTLRSLSPFIIRALIPEFYQEYFDKQSAIKKSVSSNNGTITEETLFDINDLNNATTTFQDMLKAQFLYAIQYATFNFQDISAVPLDSQPIQNVPSSFKDPGVDNPQLTKRFKLSDFKSKLPPTEIPPEIYDPINPNGKPTGFPVRANLKIAASQVEIILDTIEKALGKPINVRIISGWRSIEHNARTGANDPFGNHAQGKAIDFSVKELSIAELAAVVDILRSNGGIIRGGLGIYKSFIHYDIRGENANWIGESPDDQEHEGKLSQYVQQVQHKKGFTEEELLRTAKEVGKGVDFPTYRSTGTSENNVSMDDAARSSDSYNNAAQARKANASIATSNFLNAFKALIGVEQSVTDQGFDFSKMTPQETFQGDRITALDILYQLRAIQEIPPLVLLINPESLAINYTKVSQFTERGRYGYIYHTWGDELPKMSVSGKIGAFVTGNSNGEVGPNGVQFASKRNSAAFQNLMNLLLFYKNNGYIYNRTEARTPSTLHSVGLLAIEYDGWVYEGNMESFSYSYSEETQNGGMEFSFDFSIEKMIPPVADFNITPPTGFSVPAVPTDISENADGGFFDTLGQGALDALLGIGEGVLQENSIRETINTSQQMWDALNGEITPSNTGSETILARNNVGFIRT